MTGSARWGAGTCGVLLVVVLAETAGRCGLVDPQVLPAMSTVLLRAPRLAGDPEFVAAAAATLAMWGAGVLIGSLVAVAVGVALATLPRLAAISWPLLEWLRALPAVALIPLALLVLGDSTQATLALVAYAAGWPVVVHTLHGLRTAEPLASQTLQAFGFGRLAVAWWVALPSALPFIATGVRIAAGIGLAVTVSTELLSGGGRGIGTWLIALQSGIDQTPVMLAAVVWVAVASLLADAALTAAARRLLPWHRQVTS